MTTQGSAVLRVGQAIGHCTSTRKYTLLHDMNVRCNDPDLHVSRYDIHGFGSSGDVCHGLAVVCDVEVLHQGVVQDQLLEEPVGIVPGVRRPDAKHPHLDLGSFGP